MARVKQETISAGEGCTVHPVIQNVSRGISDWHSERDWVYQTDRAIRAIDSLAVELNKEGYSEAANYLRRIIDNNEVKAKSPDSVYF